MKKFLIAILVMLIASPAFAYFTPDGAEIDVDGLVFEGATADSSETTVSVTDPTADRTITIANSSGFIPGAGVEASAPTCAAALKGFIYVSTNAGGATDCTMASGTGSAVNTCVCDGTNYADVL